MLYFVVRAAHYIVPALPKQSGTTVRAPLPLGTPCLLFHCSDIRNSGAASWLWTGNVFVGGFWAPIEAYRSDSASIGFCWQGVFALFCWDLLRIFPMNLEISFLCEAFVKLCALTVHAHRGEPIRSDCTALSAKPSISWWMIRPEVKVQKATGGVAF